MEDDKQLLKTESYKKTVKGLCKEQGCLGHASINEQCVGCWWKEKNHKDSVKNKPAKKKQV